LLFEYPIIFWTLALLGFRFSRRASSRSTGVEDFELATATYRAACKRWPDIPITLRQGARVIEDSRHLRVVSSQ